ncbi:MAG: hypothetical protein ABIP66_01685 [Gemmatimonadaceae bacterium]
MDCRTFRKQHFAFVDDTLSGVDIVRMERHRVECPKCARLDADIRGSLRLIRNNLPTIEPSADFAQRLTRRLESERARSLSAPPLFRGPGMHGFLSMSLGVIALGLIAMTLVNTPSPQLAARLPAVVLLPSEEAESPAIIPMAPPAFVASVSTGMGVWPALLLMEEAQVRYAERESDATVRTVNYSPPSDAR